MTDINTTVETGKLKDSVNCPSRSEKAEICLGVGREDEMRMGKARDKLLMLQNPGRLGNWKHRYI